MLENIYFKLHFKYNQNESDFNRMMNNPLNPAIYLLMLGMTK